MEAGWLLTGNQFDSCDAAIFVGGGRQTTVVNNVSTDGKSIESVNNFMYDFRGARTEQRHY